MYVCDFETTVTEPVRVWLWCACDEQENILKGYDIDSFFEFIENINESCKIYFHNLRFDGSFILSACVDYGYTIVDKTPKKDKEIQAIISSSGMWYAINLKLRINYIPKNGKRTHKYINIQFLDSLKLIRGSVASIAKSFDVGTVKGECDYTKDRPIGYIADDNEVDYCSTDCIIVMRALQKAFESVTRFSNKMTSASASIATYKDIITDYKFKDLFPILDKETCKFIKRSYKGGYTYVNPKYKNVILSGLVFDVNSMYPYVMREKLMPYDKPIITYNEPPQTIPEYPLYIVSFSCDFSVKKDMLPMVQIKHNMIYGINEYVSDSKFLTPTLFLTSIDFELFIKSYDVENISYYECIYFKGKYGMFNDYIDNFMEIKKNSTGAKRETAKICLNSLYGKFGTNPERQHKIVSVVDNVVKFENSEIEEKLPIYMPIASFVTAYARQKLLNTIYEIGIERFIYCDTDSIHIKGYEMPNIDIDSKRLGAWKMEKKFIQSKFLRAKTYCEVDENNEIDFKVCGAPPDVKKKMTIDNFKYGAKFEGKLMQKQVKGGAMLVDTTFEILIDK